MHGGWKVGVLGVGGQHRGSRDTRAWTEKGLGLDELLKEKMKARQRTAKAVALRAQGESGKRGYYGKWKSG